MKRLKKNLYLYVWIVESETSARLEDCTKNVILKPDQISFKDGYHSAKITETFVFSSINGGKWNKKKYTSASRESFKTQLVCLMQKENRKKIKNQESIETSWDHARAAHNVLCCGSCLTQNETKSEEPLNANAHAILFLFRFL